MTKFSHDFLDRPEWNPLAALADFIKVDLLATAPDYQRRLAETYAPMKIRMVAEKVETYDDFHHAKQWG